MQAKTQLPLAADERRDRERAIRRVYLAVRAIEYEIGQHLPAMRDSLAMARAPEDLAGLMACLAGIAEDYRLTHGYGQPYVSGCARPSRAAMGNRYSQAHARRKWLAAASGRHGKSFRRNGTAGADRPRHAVDQHAVAVLDDCVDDARPPFAEAISAMPGRRSIATTSPRP